METKEIINEAVENEVIDTVEMAAKDNGTLKKIGIVSGLLVLGGALEIGGRKAIGWIRKKIRDKKTREKIAKAQPAEIDPTEIPEKDLNIDE